MAMAIMPDEKKSSSSRKLLIVALLVALLLTGGVFLSLSRSATALSTTAANVQSAAAPASDTQAVALGALADASDKLLVWAGNGAAPGEHSASAPGTLSFMDGTGATSQIMEIPP